MSFQTPITVKEVVDNIHKKRYLLPAIQREVVWGVEQIERLFDSLMQGYPIGSFLYWYVERNDTSNYQFYEFMRAYNERSARHNPKADVKGNEDVIGILDGQQRFTSLYIGLKGSYAFKRPRKRWNNPDAFPPRMLYLNLLSPKKEDNGDMKYDFAFLTNESAAERSEGTYWFRVGDILDIGESPEVMDYLIEHDLAQNLPKEQMLFANRSLNRLWRVVHEIPTINYFLEKDAGLDKVLNIFIRVNSGGTVLSYSDLLLSIAAAQWKKLDAREEITQFVDEINVIGGGFNFNKDFVLKSALVLSDIPDVKFKVENFNKKNMAVIEKSWDDITSALRLSVALAASFGYNRDTLTSNLALIPIAYYLSRAGQPKNYESTAKHASDRALVRHWLVAALVKGLFGGVPDNVLRQSREVLKTKGYGFPLDRIVDKFKGSPKTLTFSAEDIDSLLDQRYGQGYTFSTLSLLYPNLDYGHIIHVDHIHPRSSFRRRELVRAGVAPECIDDFQEWCDFLPNLQLLDGPPNQEKSDTPFEEWMKSVYPDAGKRAAYIERNLIPNCSFKLKDFGAFFDQRRALMKSALEAKLLKGQR